MSGFARRHFLRALGLGGAALAAPSLFSRRLAAGPAPIPTRVIFLYGMGSIRAFYPPVGIGGAPATETSFALGELHQPLVPYQSDLLVLDGLDMVSQNADPIGTNGHLRGGTHALTAAKRLTDKLSSGISIDQAIAQGLNTPTPVTKFPSIELRMGDRTDIEGGPTYNGPGGAVLTAEEPHDTFARLFPPDTLANQAAAQQKAQQKAAKQKSVLDYVSGEYASLGPKLRAADKLKLDAHASAVRDLETRLALVGTAASCKLPGASLIATEAGPYTDYAQKADVAARLVTSALSCDLTRVATLHLPTHDDLAQHIGFVPGKFDKVNDPHGLTHDTADETRPLWKNPEAMAMIKKVHVAQSQVFADLLGLLKGLPEGDGSTLLDHTVVVWCGQIAEGQHDTRKLPWMMGGRGGGAFKTGRYVKYDRVMQPDGSDIGPAHNDLFVSVANAMGVPMTTFGEPSVCKGPLPRLNGLARR